MNKKTLSESDICDKFIRPAMESAGWDGMSQIYREYPLRAGRVVVRGRKARRDASTVLRADYALFFKTNIPLAVVEAKDNNHAVGAGMAQAINYAQLLDVPFSFASHGDGFVFRDATVTDGVLERNLTLEEFPSPAELWARFCAWKGWTPEVRQVTEYDYAPAKTDLVKFAPATAQKNINLEILGSLLVPLPPKREIERIVALVKDLRQLSADLRQRLDRTRTTQASLADALVDQALAA